MDILTKISYTRIIARRVFVELPEDGRRRAFVARRKIRKPAAHGDRERELEIVPHLSTLLYVCVCADEKKNRKFMPASRAKTFGGFFSGVIFG